MRIVFLGDIVGRSGREVVAEYLPRIRQLLKIDFVVANGENAAGGFGLTAATAREIVQSGVDAITTGNHVWDQRSFVGEIDNLPFVLRPGNFPPGTPGVGERVFTLADGRCILVINAMGRLFMEPLDDPFAWIDKTLKRYRLGFNLSAAVLDFHAEATSEKEAVGHIFDGRLSLIVGTHTHVPTADHRILVQGTGYQSDAGMCGDYQSVIGVEASGAVARFLGKLPRARMEVATGQGSLSGLFLEIDAMSGLAVRIAPIRLGPHLASAFPDDLIQNSSGSEIKFACTS